MVDEKYEQNMLRLLVFVENAVCFLETGADR